MRGLLPSPALALWPTRAACLSLTVASHLTENAPVGGEPTAHGIRVGAIVIARPRTGLRRSADVRQYRVTL